ncbi:MAG: nuclease [Polyangiaceae bacterium]|nr:nuclease [Polyangiaceae bacterium]
MENTLPKRSISRVASASRRPGSHAFSAANVGVTQLGPDLDPILTVDHFKMRQPVFAPHPHAGFSAVTYLFEDSEGAFVNRDSLGHRLLAQPGAVIWTVTGRGVIHEEYPHEPGKLSHGLQVFVNLAATEKLQPPRVLFANGQDVPVLEQNGVRARVLAGMTANVRSAFEAPSDLTFLDVRLGAGAGFQHALALEANVFVYVIEGELLIEDSARTIRSGDAASFNKDGESVFVRAGSSGARFVLFAGRPLQERIVAQGPFIMNSEEQITEALQRYQAGDMGQLKPAQTVP